MIDNIVQGWWLIAMSSACCVFGCSVIYFDDIYYSIIPRFITKRYPFQIKENYTFLTGSLALSSGCLLFTSLYRLLPEALLKLNDSLEDTSAKWINFYLMISYIGGVGVCIAFNTLLHLLTSESVVHCNHGGEIEEVGLAHEHSHREHSHHEHSHHEHADEQPNEHTHSEHSHDTHSHTHHPQTHSDNSISPPSSESISLNETSKLLPQTIKSKKSFLHYIADEANTIGECKGFSSAELCLFQQNNAALHFCEIPEDLELSSHPSHGTHRHFDEEQTVGVHADHGHEDHHHHVNSPLSRLLLIGVQTTLAITLHKFPEGFITFVTAETNPQLGLSIFFSLLLHNLTEGFSMCLPLFYSFASTGPRFAKFKAFAISALLGGLSQPLGAFIGLLFLQHNSTPGEPWDMKSLGFGYGLTLSVTSGFLTVIALSMYGSAIAFGGTQNFVLFWCVFGMCIIGMSSIISA